MQRPVILGSTSRYRRELLTRLHAALRCASARGRRNATRRRSAARAGRAARAGKGHAVARRFPEAVVIGSDQVADLAGEPLGKPGDHARATAQLQRMRGQTLVFQTAVAVVCQATGFEQRDLAPVRVVFRKLERRRDRDLPARGAALRLRRQRQERRPGHRAARGDRQRRSDGLVGLPLIRTCRMLRAAGGSTCCEQRASCYLVPAPLDFGCDAAGAAAGRAAAGHAASRGRAITHWICENAKSARAYLKRIDAMRRLPRRCRRSRSRNCRARCTRRATTPASSTRGRCLPRRWTATTSGCSAKPACLPSPTRAPRWCAPRTNWGSRWCRSSARCRCCSHWRQAGSMARTSPSSATCRRMPRRASHAHPRTGNARAADRPDAAVHRNALPQCGNAAGAAADAAAQHASGGGARAHARARRACAANGEELARQAIAGRRARARRVRDRALICPAPR